MILCPAKMVILVTSSAVVFLSFFCGVHGKHSMRCSDSKVANTTFLPSEDGVKARYIMEWCTEANPNYTKWQYLITYDHDNRNPRVNTKYTHSADVEILNWTESLHCDYVCLSTPVDLVFNSTYTINNWFPEQGTQKDITNHYIVNKFRWSNFTKNKISGIDINHGDYVSVHFLLNNIPAADYSVYLCDDVHEWTPINQNCSTPFSLYEVICKLRLPPGRFAVKLTFNSPWIRSYFLPLLNYDRDITVVNIGPASVASETGTSAAVVGACAALAALCACALLLLLALRCRRAQAFRKRVLRDWLHREESKQATVEAPPAGPILLLYARECSAAEPIVSALRALVEPVAPGQVYDICSPETLALAASGGGAWVRAVMARPDARVVLLQTPALQALHTPRQNTDSGSPKLDQPLLSSRAVYRTPAAGDWLLQFALRLLAETGHQPPGAHPYRKYYLATLEGLETEALPYTVPFRRYMLPRHAATLLHDLRPQQQQEQQPQQQHSLDELARAIIDFVDFARANPDYLMDELLIL
ncbi:hypothetical protein ABMA27_002362 [Loxostege sticticalis]|uniref:SEFIR domain-containing protein n=1 Tax=Loxostege sticticalis TaxID=481309 RepID=A0ABR3HXI9_LOXSC